MSDKQLKFLLIWQDACQPHIDLYLGLRRVHGIDKALEMWAAWAHGVLKANAPDPEDDPAVFFERQLAACSILYVDLLIMFGCFNDE